MNDLAYELAMVYAKAKFEEYCRRMEDSKLFGDPSVLFNSLEDFFEEAYNYYKSIDNFNSLLNR